MPLIQENLKFMPFNVTMAMYLATYGSLILVGIVIGLFGSAIAMRRYLKV